MTGSIRKLVCIVHLKSNILLLYFGILQNFAGPFLKFAKSLQTKNSHKLCLRQVQHNVQSKCVAQITVLVLSICPHCQKFLQICFFTFVKGGTAVCVCTVYPVYLLVEVKFPQSLITFFCVKIESKCDCRETLALKQAGTIQLGILLH